MGMYRLSDPGLRSVALYDLLDPPRGKRSTAACFEQVSVFGICLQVTLQYQPKAGRKQDIAGEGNEKQISVVGRVEPENRGVEYRVKFSELGRPPAYGGKTRPGSSGD